MISEVLKKIKTWLALMRDPARLLFQIIGAQKYFFNVVFPNMERLNLALLMDYFIFVTLFIFYRVFLSILSFVLFSRFIIKRRTLYCTTKIEKGKFFYLITFSHLKIDYFQIKMFSSKCSTVRCDT